jgi:hypothetical protein
MQRLLKWILTPFGLLALVVGIWGLGWAPMLFTKDAQWRSDVGGMFQIVGVLISGLAFAGIIYTIRLQIEEQKASSMSQQKTEEALLNQAESLRLQVVAITEQRRLSVLPFFAAHFNRSGRELYPLEFFNIGYGTALNVSFGSMKVQWPERPGAVIKTIVPTIAILIRPGEEIGIKFELFEAADSEYPTLTQSPYFINSELTRMDFSFDIRFEDIEGRNYSQAFVVKNSVFRPGPVKLVN